MEYFPERREEAWASGLRQYHLPTRCMQHSGEPPDAPRVRGCGAGAQAFRPPKSMDGPASPAADCQAAATTSIRAFSFLTTVTGESLYVVPLLYCRAGCRGFTGKRPSASSTTSRIASKMDAQFRHDLIERQRRGENAFADPGRRRAPLGSCG